MTDIDPLKEEYLAVVSEWSGYGHQSSSLVGNAYPLFCLSRGEPVEKPIEQFPNPGYIFLVNRGELTAWDFVRIRPGLNKKYKNASLRECYYIAMSTPPVLDASAGDLGCATILDVSTFDPSSSTSPIRNPGQGVTPIFFVRNIQQRIFGPLVRTQVMRNRSDMLDAIHWEPCGNDGVIYEFTPEDFKRLGIRQFSYSHPESDLNAVVEQPYDLLGGPLLTATTSKAYDRLPDTQLAEWYLRWRDYTEVPEEMLRVLRNAPDYLSDTPSSILRQRCRRLATIFTSLDILQTERRNVARRYLETQEGRGMLEQQLALEISRRAQTIEDEVKKRRSELAQEEKRLATQLEELREGYKARAEEVARETQELEKERGEMQGVLAALETQLQNGVDRLADQMRDSVPLLAALTSGLRGPRVSEVRVTSAGHDGFHPSRDGRTGPLWSDVRPALPTKELARVSNEPALVEQLAIELMAGGLSFTRDFIANLYVTLKSSALNLITGPPGHGKSSVVAGLARALGHGQALLEIAVRRSWSDDRYLLGFYDTFHGRYDPGPAGLSTRLLQAQCDWEQNGQGLYLILLDEFNLAAPEYYFSQLLQLLPRVNESRILRLFDPALIAGEQGAKDVHQIVLHPNVVFWGTINYDETTERLSPRLLDRTGMIFLTGRDVSPSLTVAEARTRGP
jgi:hypothetical protein